MKTQIILTALLMGCVSNLCAQHHLGINFKAYQATGAFQDNVKSVPLGFSFSYLRQGEESRFSWGGELGIAMYSNKTYQYELVEEGFPGEYTSVDEEDCFWTIHGFARYDIYSTNSFRTYAEVRLGMTTFFSTRISTNEDKRFNDTSEFHGTAFNSGLGAGLMLNPKGLFSKDLERGRLWINLGANFHSGSNTTYRNIDDENQSYSMDEGKYKSLTHYVGYRLGIMFSL